MEVALLLFMLAELSFGTGAGSSTFLIPQAHKVTFSCLDPHILSVLCAATLLHNKGKESISISLLAPLFVTKGPVNQCRILCLLCIWVWFSFFSFNLWALYLWKGMPRFPSLPSLHWVWLWNAHFHYGETICYVWGISSTRHNISL